MKAIIPVSSTADQLTAVTPHAHVYIFLFWWKELCFGCSSFRRVTNKIIRAELTIGFNMAVFGSIRLTWNSDYDAFVMVHACLEEERSEHVRWLVFVSLRCFLQFSLQQTLTKVCQCQRGNGTFFMSPCQNNMGLHYIFIPFKTQC